MKNIVFIFLILPFLANSQETITFAKNKTFYLRGDTHVIGNNTLSKNKTKAFNNANQINDKYKMTYVDIDKDNSTFSSSASELEIPSGSNIVYAGLYWTGTYPGNKGIKRINGNREIYDTVKKRDKPLNIIKLKLPNNNYRSIVGEILYDGKKEGSKIALKIRSPYVCYKDITELIKGLSTPNGLYTVANVPALEGLMSGGSSAGWMLYVVYENNTSSLKYITSYDGFEFINRKSPIIDFKNFKSPEEGEVQTEITIGALEGDNSIDKDRVSVFNVEKNAFIALSNSVREVNNFFNSSITIDENILNKRIPNSTNTLGFDIAKFKILNEENKLTPNNVESVSLKFETQKDEYFLFFTAFQTTLSETYYQETVVTPPTLKIVKENNISESIADTKPLKKQKENAIVESKLDKEIRAKELKKISKSNSIKIPDLSAGYYIVTNVFSNKANAEKWSRKLRSKNFNPDIFSISGNNYYYVSIKNNTDVNLLYNDLKEIRLDNELTKAWILKVNLE